MVPKIYWLTGLSGSGKTTLSKLLKKFFSKKNKKILLVDGDRFRKKNNSKNSFSEDNIIKNNIKIIKFVKEKANKFDYIIVSVISPFLKTRKIAKKIFRKNFYEIYVYCKIATLKKRDTKGLYKKADKKIINNLIGYKSKIKYEISNYKNIKINTDLLSKNKSIKKILYYSNES